MARRLLMAVGLLVGLADLQPEEAIAGPGGGQADIVGGQATGGNPEVAFIIGLDEALTMNVLCTGTLIQPKLVLTAAHCVDDHVFPVDRYVIYFGTDALAESDPGFEFATEATSVVVHPQWNIDDLDAGNDIALVHLVDEVPIAPAAIRTQPLTQADIGAPVHLVGWGDTGASTGDAGIKRDVTSRLDEIEGNLVVVGNADTNTCHGDSGGPAFLEVGGVEQVIGVTSFGDADCLAFGVSTRVDAFIDFIAANAGPGGGGMGSPCTDPAACQSGVCVTGAGETVGFCTELCGALTPCDAGFECVQIDAENAVCAPPDRLGGGGQLGDDCAASSDCAGGLCLPSFGGGVCSAQCAGPADCPDGFSCDQVQGGSACLASAAGGRDGDDGEDEDEDEGGCSAAGSGRSSGSGGVSALALALLALALGRAAHWRSPSRLPRRSPPE